MKLNYRVQLLIPGLDASLWLGSDGVRRWLDDEKFFGGSERSGERGKFKAQAWGGDECAAKEAPKGEFMAEWPVQCRVGISDTIPEGDAF